MGTKLTTNLSLKAIKGDGIDSGGSWVELDR